jgi:hypothetical protein
VESAINAEQMSLLERVEVNTLAGAVLELATSELIPVFHSAGENPESEKKILSDYLATILEEGFEHHHNRAREQTKELVSSSIKVWTKEFRIIIHLLLLLDVNKTTSLAKTLIAPLADYAVRCLYDGFKNRKKVAEEIN